MTNKRPGLLKLWGCLLFACSARSDFEQPPVVSLKCGKISGSVAPVKYANRTLAFSYASIPFAAPPVNELRFRAPVAPSCPWTGIRNGSAVPNVCVQTGGGGSEDCLYLHVVRPTAEPPAGGWPVYVTFHGGNLIGGGTPYMLSQSQVIATQIPGGGVLVAAAYRLNTLGWLADASLDEESGFSGNYGLLDAIAALEWVRVATKHYQ